MNQDERISALVAQANSYYYEVEEMLGEPSLDAWRIHDALSHLNGRIGATHACHPSSQNWSRDRLLTEYTLTVNSINDVDTLIESAQIVLTACRDAAVANHKLQAVVAALPGWRLLARARLRARCVRLLRAEYVGCKGAIAALKQAGRLQEKIDAEFAGTTKGN